MQGLKRPPFRGWRLVKILLIAVVLAWGSLAIYLGLHWPFSERRITQDLEHFSSCKLKIDRFHPVFFPHPGYIAEGFTLTRSSGGRDIQMASISKVTCIGGWISMMMFQHRVEILRLEGLHVWIPAPVPPAIQFFPSMKDKTTVDTLIADGAMLDVASRNGGGNSFQFAFEKLILKNVKKQNSISLQTVLHLPVPSGTLTVHGQFGPFSRGRVGNTRLSGSYLLKNAQLEGMDNLEGTLNAHGSLAGTLSNCAISGVVGIDGFTLRTVQHNVNLNGSFHTTLNALKGDVIAPSVVVQFEKTKLEARGTIEGAADRKGKVASFVIQSENARIEDLLWLFTKSETPAMQGPITLKARVVLPPGKSAFLRRVQLSGGFVITNAEFLHAKAARNLDKLSQRALGQHTEGAEPDSKSIPLSFQSKVVAQDGVATLSHADFKTAGAAAWGSGTYNLLSQAIDLRGKLAIKASLSKAAGGFKSILLLPLDPLFKKGGAGAEVPIHITGTYSHPRFRVSLTGK